MNRPPGANGAARGNGGQAGQGGQGGGQGGFGGQVNVTPAQCDSVTKKLAAKPALRDRIGALRRQMMDGSAGDEARQQMRALSDSVGVEPREARACTRQAGGGQGGQGGQGAAAAGAGGAGAGGRGGFAGMGGGRGRAQRGLVFVKKGETFEPRVVTLGLGNFDVTEVVSGLQDGEQVALVSAAVLQQSRTEFQDRLRSRSGLPGMGGGGGAPAGGAGGGRPGGGGGGAPGGGGGGGGRGGA